MSSALWSAIGVAGRGTAAVIAAGRLAQAARRARPLEAPGTMPGQVRGPATETSISVVVPARDEAGRIGPLLEVICGAPGVHEVIVVDDESTDATAAISLAAGARVVSGSPLPPGWAGKAWALQQGITAASGDWVVTLDADTRPSPELARAVVARALDDGLDFVTVAGRFECPTTGAAWLHPAMLTTLVYRYGPPGSGPTGPTARPRVLANGQCMAADRRRLLDDGGLAPVAHHVVEDVALARALAARGRRVAIVDGAALLTTTMFDDLRTTWHGWRRSLALPGVESFARQIGDVLLLTATTVLPLLRIARRRADALDLALLALRLGTLAGTRRAYRFDRPDQVIAYALSPLADPVAVAAVADGAVRHALGRPHRWRGRDYPAT